MKPLANNSTFLSPIVLSLLWAVSSAVSCGAQTLTITTVAGGGNPPYPSVGDGGAATSAYLSAPEGIAVDNAGNLFIAESRVRKVTAAGIISTVASNNASGVAVDGAGNLYIAAPSNGGSVIKIASDGTVTTLATLPAGNFGGPDGIAVDSTGNVYYSWRGPAGHVVSKLTSPGNSSIIAGGGTISASLGDNGPATRAYLDRPRGLAVDASGNLYIADFGDNRVRKVNPGGTITTLQANLNGPDGVAVDAAGNVYVTESAGNTVRVIHTDGSVAIIAGTGAYGSSGDDGLATNATLGSPYGIAVSSSGLIYISTQDGLVRVLAPPLPAPAISTGGVVPVFSSVTTIQPGEWVSIYGSNLAPRTVLWNGDFPTSLGGTTVTINGKPAYLWLVSPGQINLQAPDDPTASGTVPVVVTTASGSSTSTVTLAPFAPSFSLLDGKHITGIIIRSAGSYDIIGPTGTSLGYPTVAAKPGDFVELFGVGFGPTAHTVPAGKAFSGAEPANDPVTLSINNVTVQPSFIGLSSAGLYQFNLTIPTGLGTGDVPVQATVGGAQTPSGVVISLQ